MRARRLCFPLAALLTAQSASAVDYYWKGVTIGNWRSQDPGNWYTAADGLTPHTAFPNSLAASDLFFNITSANAASSIISNAGGARNARSLTFNSSGTTTMRAGGSTANSLLTIGAGGITLGASSGNVTLGDTSGSFGTLTVALAASQSWTNNSASTLTVSGAVSGDFALTKAGAGTLELTNANTYSGTTILSAGTLNINNAGSGGTSSAIGTSALTISGASVIDNSTGADIILSTSNALNLDANFTFTGTRSLSIGTGAATTLSNNRIITVSANTFTLGGNIAAAAHNLTKSGAGILELSGTNALTGSTSISGGMLKISGTSSLSTGNLILGGSGILGLANGNFSRTVGSGAGQARWSGSGGFAAYGGDRTVNLGATVGWSTTSFLSGTDALVLSAADADATLIWSSGLSFAGQQRTIQVNKGSVAVDARITGKLTGGTSSGLNKTGAGTLELTNSNNDYTGATNVNAGTLLIGTSGSLANTSAVTVGGAAATGTPTLGGGGTIAGATTIAAAGGGAVGTHAPGVAGVSGGVGSQTFSNNLTYQSGSIFEWDINTAANTSDSVSVGGSLIVDSAAIFKIVSSTAFTDVFWDATRNWNVFGGKDFDAFTLDFVANNVALNAVDFASEGAFTFTNSGATLTWTAVPEPGSALAGLLLGAGLLRRRRK